MTAGLLEQLSGALNRFEAREETEHDVRLFERYGKVDKWNRKVKLNYDVLVEKTQLAEATLRTRFDHGLGTSASAANETGWFSGLSTRSQSKRATGLVHTGNQRVTKMLNGSR